MRVIAGCARGARLTMPGGPAIRPTPGRVKAAVFSHLGDRVLERRLLDLFCGTGALGIEAVSRGAASAVLVDRSRFSVRASSKNADLARVGDRIEVRQADVFEQLAAMSAAGDRFDIVLADPPYHRGGVGMSLAKKLLHSADLVSIVTADGIVAVEHAATDLIECPAVWMLRRQLRHGDTAVSFWTLLSARTEDT